MGIPGHCILQEVPLPAPPSRFVLTRFWISSFPVRYKCSITMLADLIHPSRERHLFHKMSGPLVLDRVKEFQNSQYNSGCERGTAGFCHFSTVCPGQDMRGRIHSWSSLCFILPTAIHLRVSLSSSAKGGSLTIRKDKNTFQEGTRK